MEALGVDRLIYDGKMYDKMNTFLADLPFYTKWCRQAEGEVLELCCGTGRLTIPLRKAGIPITGLDFTPMMLERARDKASEADVDLDFVQGDMRNFDLQKRFKLIFIPFNSLQNTYTRTDLERVFASVRKHLAPGGRFIVDVFNPSIHFMVNREKEFTESFRFVLDDGRECRVLERCRYDAARQVNRVTWKFLIGDEEHNQKLDMRCFYPEELDALLHYNDFEVIHKFGSWDESPFSTESQKQLCVCEVRTPIPESQKTLLGQCFGGTPIP